jgi:addiction module HigA family antidote
MKSPPNIHPGEVLLKQFLAPRGISRNALARSTGLSPGRINDIVLGRRDVTLDTDERLASALATDKCFWLALQAEFDLEKARAMLGTSQGLETDLQNLSVVADEPSGFWVRESDGPVSAHGGQPIPGLALIGSPGGRS